MPQPLGQCNETGAHFNKNMLFSHAKLIISSNKIVQSIEKPPLHSQFVSIFQKFKKLNNKKTVFSARCAPFQRPQTKVAKMRQYPTSSISILLSSFKPHQSPPAYSPSAAVLCYNQILFSHTKRIAHGHCKKLRCHAPLRNV